MEAEETSIVIKREEESFKDANLLIGPEAARRVRIVKHPINNELEYLGSIKLRIDAHAYPNGEEKGLRFRIESLRPELNLSFRIKGEVVRSLIHEDDALKELLGKENLSLGPGGRDLKRFLNGLGIGIKEGCIEIGRRGSLIVKDTSPSLERKRRDEVILHCYNPPGTTRPAYGAWCLACCAICPLPTGLTYIHLAPHTP
jgi:hypothetical protein